MWMVVKLSTFELTIMAAVSLSFNKFSLAKNLSHQIAHTAIILVTKKRSLSIHNLELYIPISDKRMAAVVHTNADGTIHSRSIEREDRGLGSVTLGGATFIIDRDGQVEAGKTAEFGVEHVGARRAWCPPSLGRTPTAKLCEPVEGEGPNRRREWRRTGTST